MISFDRVRQRKLVQWAVAYLAAAWLILQVLSLLAEPFAWPGVVLRAATVLLGVGFIGVLVLAWYHGERGRQHVSGIELILLAVVLALAGAAVWWVRDDSPDQRADAQPVISVGRNSIAVLPFLDLSPGKDHEYFSDGITEEILNALARVERLRVASRTSSFSFKGRNVPIDEVGKRLRVQHVLEGSVQRSGERIRVTAQLVDAANGYHLWSERYDRELQDIFAVEDEISRAIVQSLEVEITGGHQDPLVARATESQEAHDLYLKGRYFWANRTPDGLRRAIQYFEQATQLDPNYARAYQGLATRVRYRNHAAAGIHRAGLHLRGPVHAHWSDPTLPRQARGGDCGTGKRAGAFPPTLARAGVSRLCFRSHGPACRRRTHPG